MKTQNSRKLEFIYQEIRPLFKKLSLKNISIKMRITIKAEILTKVANAEAPLMLLFTRLTIKTAEIIEIKKLNAFISDKQNSKFNP